VVLRDQASISWLLGVRSHVPQTLDASCFDVVVEIAEAGAPQLSVLTNAIEAPRLRETELAGLDARWHVVPWWEDREKALPAGEDVVGDRSYPGVRSVPFGPVRRRLTAHQAALLRSVSHDAAQAATAAATALSPKLTEYAAAGVLAAELLERNLDPVVLLVAGHDRIAGHRHPLPTAGPLGRRALLVCCARRHGLVASVTRIVAFGHLSPGERAAYERLLQVEAAFLDATRPGVRIGSIVTTGVGAYGRHGFEPDEWRRHHQGGFTGWQPREYPAHLTSGDVVPDQSAIAWNPSGGGWKVEDTAIVGETGPDLLVHDGRWPTVTVRGRRRPDVLELT
jgi:antitoxin VapB